MIRPKRTTPRMMGVSAAGVGDDPADVQRARAAATSRTHSATKKAIAFWRRVTGDSSMQIVERRIEVSQDGRKAAFHLVAATFQLHSEFRF